MSQMIEDWRAQLPGHLTPSSKNRLLNDLRTALNAAATKYRHQMPPDILIEIKVGTKVEAVTAAARRQLLTNAQVRAVVKAAYEAIQKAILAGLCFWRRLPVHASRSWLL